MVEISFEHKKRPVEYHYDEEAQKLTQDFADKLNNELDDLLKGVILFGSAVRGDNQEHSDIDILILLNDLDIVFSDEVVHGIRVIIENTASSVSEKFHITTMHLSEFWEYVKSGDPIIVNMLREGKPVYDAGFFSPIQALLDTGKLRPSKEAVWVYYLRAPKTLKSAREHMLSSTVDLYWAVIDAAHASLMHVDVIPGAPHQVADLFQKHYVDTNVVDKKYERTIRKFYKMAKDIGHKELKEIKGNELDDLLLEAEDFVKRVKLLLNTNPQELKK